VSKIIVDTIESTGTTVTVNDGLASGAINAGTNAITAGSVTGLTATSITSGTLADGIFASDSILFIQESVLPIDGTVASDPGSGFADATGVTITVPAADVNECSKLIVTMSGQMRIDKATHAYGGVRITRTAPSTVNGATMHLGVVSGGTEVYNCFVPMMVDESLSNADHTYKLEYSGLSATYSSTMYPRNGQTVITVLGVK